MHYFLCSLNLQHFHTCGGGWRLSSLMTFALILSLIMFLNVFFFSFLFFINFQLISVVLCMSVRRLKIQVSVLYVLSLISLVSVSLAVTLLSPYHLVFFSFVFLFKLFISILRFFFYLIKFALSNYNYNFINNHLN